MKPGRAVGLLLAAFAGLAGTTHAASGDGVPWSKFKSECREQHESPDPITNQPVLVKGVWPDAPRDGRGDNTVWVMIRVGTDGRVKSPVLCYTNNSTYAMKVIEAVRHWQYKPATRDGLPIEAHVFVATTMKTRHT